MTPTPIGNALTYRHANPHREVTWLARTLIVAAIWLVVLVVYAVTAAVTAHAQAKPPVTIAQALSMMVALRSLDGRAVIIKKNGADETVVVPWEFGSGALRVRIARNLALLAATEKAAEEARTSILREVMKKTGPIAPNSPEMDDFLRQYGEVLNAPAPESDALLRIKIPDLRLDKNEIPGTTLAALVPILDE